MVDKNLNKNFHYVNKDNNPIAQIGLQLGKNFINK